MVCMRVDCDREATHAVKLVVPDSLSDETSAEGLIGVELCQAHMDEARAWEFTGVGSAFSALVGWLARPGTVPDLSEAYVESVPVGSPEHRAFMRLRPN